MDIDVERAEAQLDALIERRAREAEEANRIHAAWAESARSYDVARARERRLEWCEYHRCMIAVGEDLAARHRDELGRLIDSAAG